MPPPNNLPVGTAIGFVREASAGAVKTVDRAGRRVTIVGMRKTTLVLAALLTAAVLAVPAATVAAGPAAAGMAGSRAPAADRAAATTSAPHYRVTVTRTEGGIPHIVGRTYGDVGFGYGFAFAQDNVCVMAKDYVTVEGQRSRWFGPHKSYLQRANGVRTSNLASDEFWTEVRDSGIVGRLARRRPPLGPSPTLLGLLHGYVAGYNHYLASVGGSSGIHDPACHGQPWVRPITMQDAFLRFYQLVLFASEDVVIPGIGQASPPPAGSAGAAAGLDAQRAGRLIAAGWHRAMGKLGSNAVAVGRSGTRDHRHGLLLGNPHFPWLGTERFYQAQLVVPGKLDVSGASLFGVPLILIGHTRTMAWSHTVSTAFRFTPYQLTLVPGRPTSYLFNGKPKPMQARRVAITERAHGRLRTVHHTLWWTRYGPVFTSLEGIPLPWTTAEAFTMRDANADNFRVFDHFFATDRARSAKQELHILKRYQGIPWVNTIVADRAGHALYADIGAVPDVTDAKAQRCDTELGTVTFRLLGLPVLDGSRSACDWGHAKGAVEPGLLPPSKLPHLFRRDYVTNSNDSYWLSNPPHRLTGYPRIVGDTRTPRSLRTRVGLIMTQARVSGTDHHGPAGFTLHDMTHMVFDNRQYAGDLTRSDLVRLCRSLHGSAPTSSGGTVTTGNACTVLHRWDLHENARSHGAILFRRFWDRLTGSSQQTAYTYSGRAGYWKHQFSASSPVRTPYGLDTSDPEVAQALGDAIADLRAAHYPLGVTPGAVQGVRRHGRFIPIQGGEGDPNGDFNAIYADWRPGKGLGQVYDGSSFVQVVTWHGASSCPVARTILTYSESTDPTDPHYSDMTRRFSHKRWYVDRYCPAQIRADPHRSVETVAGP